MSQIDPTENDGCIQYGLNVKSNYVFIKLNYDNLMITLFGLIANIIILKSHIYSLKYLTVYQLCIYRKDKFSNYLVKLDYLNIAS